MIKQTPLRQALDDPLLLGTVLTGPSWFAWRVLLIAAMGEELTDAERQLFQQVTGRDHEPDRMVEEFVGVIARRGGKTRAISAIGTYIGGLCRHPSLVPGERGVLLIIAPDQTQADICLGYIEANFKQSPILSQLIEARTQRALKLTNKIDIEVRASNFRTLRGLTLISAICDESAFFYNSENSANPDSEILQAVRPGLGTTGGPLFMISSPYARRGELWNVYNQHFGGKGDPSILVAQAAIGIMNPSLPQSVVDRAYERDPASADAEYGANFRRDILQFVILEVVMAVVAVGVRERSPKRRITYVAFVDPSGGSADSFTLAIGHLEGDIVMIDVLREHRPPFSPEGVVTEFAALLKTYNVNRVTGDKYAAQWPVEVFSKASIHYEQSAPAKSELYQAALALLNSGRISLLDNQRLINQLVGLERRTARGGKNSIDHAPGGHDDCANAVCGLAAMLTAKPSYNLNALADIDDDDDDPDGARAFRMQRFMEHIRRYG